MAWAGLRAPEESVTPGGLCLRRGRGEPSALRHLHREPRPPVPGHSSGESRPGCSRCRRLTAPARQLLPPAGERCLPSRRLPQTPPGLREPPLRPSGRSAGMRCERRRARSKRCHASLGLSSLFPCQVGKALLSPCRDAAEEKLLFFFPPRKARQPSAFPGRADLMAVCQKSRQKEAAGSGSSVSPAGMLEEQQPRFSGQGGIPPLPPCW